MDDPFLMRVLDGLTDFDEELDPFASSQALVVAIRGDGNAVDQLHREIGASAIGRSRVEGAGNRRMIHHRERLALGLEAGDDLFGIHAKLDDLESDPPLERLTLLGHVDDTHSTFTQDLKDPVRSDLCRMIDAVGCRYSPASVGYLGRIVDSHRAGRRRNERAGNGASEIVSASRLATQIARRSRHSALRRKHQEPGVLEVAVECKSA